MRDTSGASAATSRWEGCTVVKRAIRKLKELVRLSAGLYVELAASALTLVSHRRQTA